MKNEIDRAANWLADQGVSGIEQRGYAEELAVVTGSQTIASAIESAGITRSVLAERLGCHKSFVTRVLGGPQNMTLSTLGAFLWGCGFEVSGIELAPVGANGFVEEPTKIEVSVGTAIGAAAECYGLGTTWQQQFVEPTADKPNNNLALAA